MEYAFSYLCTQYKYEQLFQIIYTHYISHNLVCIQLNTATTNVLVCPHVYFNLEGFCLVAA